jgi:hypothetical protein
MKPRHLCLSLSLSASVLGTVLASPAHAEPPRSRVPHEVPRKFFGAPPDDKAGLSRPRAAQRSGASTARERQASEASLGEGTSS